MRRGPLALSALLLAIACSSGGGDPPDGSEFPRGTILRNVVFCSPGGTALRMDLYFPEEPSVRPTLVFIHGGAWTTGTKEESQELWLRLLREPLVGRGFIVASIEYRLSGGAGGHQWPAHIQDSQCAVRYLRAHAGEYGILTDRIGAWGTSAGAHLAALLGTAPDDAFGPAGEWNGFSSRVVAVVDLYGPADLTADDWKTWQTAVFPAVFGTGNQQDPVLADASPVTHVSSGDAPFLIFHGDEDVIVPVTQSGALDEALDAAGVSSELVVVANGNHGLNPEISGPIDPAPEEISARIVDFFAGRLGP